jgi:hypothetical protein
LSWRSWIVLILADHRLVGRDLHHADLVDLHELRGLGQGRARHAGELVVHAEVVLQRDGRERLVLLAHAHALLGLDGLVQALRPAAAVQDAPGELVDDLDLAVDDGVVDIALVERLGLQRLVQVVDQVAVLGAVEVFDPEEALGLLDPLLADRDRLVLLVELVVVVRDELLLRARIHPFGLFTRGQQRSELGEAVVEVAGLLGRAGDDQRRARLVDQDVVDLVDDREMVHRERAAVLADAPAVLDLLLEAGGHVVAQVVEPELGVRAVRDVRRVGRALLLVGLVVLEHADGQAEAFVDRPHPVRVAAGQVVVDRDHVHALAGERVDDHGERAGERLALARAHLGDLTVMEDHAADQLHVEMTHLHPSAAHLAGQREGLGQQLVDVLAVAGALAQLRELLRQLVVGGLQELRLPVVDPFDALGVGLELLRFAHSEGALEDGHSYLD